MNYEWIEMTLRMMWLKVYEDRDKEVNAIEKGLLDAFSFKLKDALDLAKKINGN